MHASVIDSLDVNGEPTGLSWTSNEYMVARRRQNIILFLGLLNGLVWFGRVLFGGLMLRLIKTVSFHSWLIIFLGDVSRRAFVEGIK